MTITYGEFQRQCLDGPRRHDLLAEEADGGQFTTSLHLHLDEVLGRAPTTMISVDVFDTVLIRRPTSELTRFVEIAEAQAAELQRWADADPDPLDLVIARLQATHASYSVSEPRRNCREGSVTQIYRSVARTLGLKPGCEDVLIDAELAYEASALTANAALLQWLNEQHARGIEITLLSDMYLHNTHIRQLLDRHSICEEFDLVSSADEKYTKASGFAFDLLLETRELDPTEVVHIGDNLWSDYSQSRRRGIRSAYLPIPRVERLAIKEDHNQMLAQLSTAGHRFERWISL